MREPSYPPCGDAKGDEIRLRDFNTLTFDVVGTLIDFETDILDWFRPGFPPPHLPAVSFATIPRRPGAPPLDPLWSSGPIQVFLRCSSKG